jgi:hypothetical protein
MRAAVRYSGLSSAPVSDAAEAVGGWQHEEVAARKGREKSETE